MNKEILKTDVQLFISNHLHDGSTSIALGKSPFVHVSPRELAEQIDSKKRSERKLPTWFNANGVYYPPKLSIEQSSSETTAAYKSKLTKGSTVVDVTGGFGVDSFYFSRAAKHVLHCELDTELSNIAKHNAAVIGADNIDFFQGDGMAYLQGSNVKFDTIFIDPSRRIKSQKVFFLKECEPDVPANLDLLLAKAQRIIIKTSPLLDISSGLKELKNVSQIHVISIKNDCKELLWIIDKGFEGEPEIICAAMTNEKGQALSFYQKDEKETNLLLYSKPLKYLYEPDAALLKAGCFKLIAEKYAVLKLDKNTHLYTSFQLIINFIGKIFLIEAVMDYKTFSKANTVKKANIVARNFPLSTAELKKKHRIEDGGDVFLIFTKTDGGELTVILCRKTVQLG